MTYDIICMWYEPQIELALPWVRDSFYFRGTNFSILGSQIEDGTYYHPGVVQYAINAQTLQSCCPCTGKFNGRAQCFGALELL